MKRKIIKIDENLCNGCGLCVEGCHEGAIKIINGKARVTDDVFCDGLGACLKKCPVNALSIEEREAAPFSLEAAQNAARQMPEQPPCQATQCRQWPLQLHLVNPAAPFFKESSVVLAADCSAFAAAFAGAFAGTGGGAAGGSYETLLKGCSLAIACPKLDDGKEIYIEKITALIEHARIKSLTVIMMEVPCCGGLLYIAQEAAKKASRSIPIKKVIVGIDGVIKMAE